MNLEQALESPLPLKMWVYKTLKPQDVPEQMQKLLMAVGSYAFIAGGAARYCIFADRRGELTKKGGPVIPPPTDIDLFCYTEEDESHTHDALLNAGYEQFGETSWCTRYGHMGEPLEVQVVKANDTPLVSSEQRTSGTMEEVLNGFDFTVNMAAFNAIGVAVYSSQLDHALRSRELIVNKVVDPIDLIRRVGKYYQKGFTISRRESEKILEGWRSLDSDIRRNLNSLPEQEKS